MRRIYEPTAYRPEVNSYWQTTASLPLWPRFHGDRTAGTVIIGGGYTGINCALELVAQGCDPQSIVILEANQPGWGASGRNGGFCCNGGTKLPVSKQLSLVGEAETVAFFNEQLAAIETVRSNLEQFGIDADTHSRGETGLAHRDNGIEELEAEQRQIRSLFGIDTQLIAKSDLAAKGLDSPEFHGALTTTPGFALNPMKYIGGLTRAAAKLRIATFGKSPATTIRHSSAGWQVETPAGKVTAENLVIATNGYSSEDVPDWLAGRLLPVLSNIIVTRPLSPSELQDQGWTSYQMCCDTRRLLHYFRLMPAVNGEPGPRMLFGMRGGTSCTPRAVAAMRRDIRSNFDRFFPAWHHVETPFFWTGLVCITYDLSCYVGPVPEMPGAWTSTAYHGNGVSMASHGGRLLARMIAGGCDPGSLPRLMRYPPRRFPIPALRRAYLAAAYRWYEWRDG